MNLRDHATNILLGATLEAKLAAAPPGLDDDDRGAGCAPRAPAREPRIAIEVVTRRKKKVPPISGFGDPNQRVRILHALANHELQAIELFAWAILEYVDAPASFRRGLLLVLTEEQRHFRLYQERLTALGARFGDWPLSGYFWTRAAAITTPLSFVCAMCLTFENANLDHAVALEEAARAAGDEESARALRIVHDDEIGHVRFGLFWLREWKDAAQSDAVAWLANIAFPLRPALARGEAFRDESRRRAGFDDEFVALLAAAERPRALYHFVKAERDNG